MHFIFGKKQIIIAALVTVLGLAVFVNWYCTENGVKLPGFSSEKTEQRDSAAEYVNGLTEEEYFASVRLTRDSTRDKAMEELKAVIASAGEDNSAAENTAKTIENLNNEAKMESDIESLVSGKTGSECVAVISENTVDVVVPDNILNDSNVLTISDVISQVCAGKYENIKISGANA